MKKLPGVQPFLMLLLLLTGALIFPPLNGMDWPAPDAPPVYNFGANQDGMPALGTSFSSGDDLYPAARGEIIFHHTEDKRASRLPAPLGNWIALDHGDGLVSIYGRLEGEHREIHTPIVERETVIGLSGSSGWSDERGFYFSFFDRKERRWVNPSMIISPRTDTQAPVIRGVRLKNGEGRFVNLSEQRTLSQGQYTVYVDAADAYDGRAGNPLAPHRISCSVNGSEIGTLSFETFTAPQGKLMANRNGLTPAAQVYAEAPFYETGSVILNRGQAVLEIIVQDIAGNARSSTFRLVIE